MPTALKLMKEDKSQRELSGIMLLEQKVLDNQEGIHCN